MYRNIKHKLHDICSILEVLQDKLRGVIWNPCSILVLPCGKSSTENE